MESTITNLREKLDDLLDDLNKRAEEVRENFSSFREVFGEEFKLQAENFKEYRERLTSKGRKYFDVEGIVEDIRDEADHAVRDLHSNVDRFLDALKERIEKAK